MFTLQYESTLQMHNEYVSAMWKVGKTVRKNREGEKVHSTSLFKAKLIVNFSKK